MQGDISMSNKALQQYSSFLEKINLSLPLAPYDWDQLHDSISSEWIAYSQYMSEHNRELANVINDFRRYLTSLSAWRNVLEDTDDEQEKYNIVTEYVSPLATLTLTLPYVIRSRFIFSSAHLSHQANKLKQDIWVDDLPIDSKIYFEDTDKYSKAWKRYPKFKLALEKIANQKYNEATHDFRNQYNHRYSPHIEFGLTGLVRRTVNKAGGVRYSFGETAPLMLQDIIPLLEKQHTGCILAFEKYQDLINEQVIEINNAIQSLE